MTSSGDTAGQSVKYIDAGANLLDSMYQGTYHGKPRHEPDLDIVLQRAHEKGVQSIISLAGTVKESKELLDLINDLDQNEDNDRVKVFGTVGIHPTRCAEEFAEKDFDGDTWIPKKSQQQTEIIQNLTALASKGKTSGNVVAIGEFGLDYARLEFCPKDIQHIGLRAQLEVAIETKLPLYLHNRDSGDDLFAILSEYKDRLSVGNEGGIIRGIVHSFDETVEIANKFISLGLYIGINGCSLKTQENIANVKVIALERLILETDCPWCDIRQTHAGYSHIQSAFPSKKEKQYSRDIGKEFCVKNRTEPCHVAQVAEVVAGIKSLSVEEVVNVCCKNVHDLFGSLEKS